LRAYLLLLLERLPFVWRIKANDQHGNLVLLIIYCTNLWNSVTVPTKLYHV
jgi:hypothetical protein